jgi:hypothetical protein
MTTFSSLRQFAPLLLLASVTMGCTNGTVQTVRQETSSTTTAASTVILVDDLGFPIASSNMPHGTAYTGPDLGYTRPPAEPLTDEQIASQVNDVAVGPCEPTDEREWCRQFYADTAPPTMTAASDPAPTVTGWFNGPVTVTWTAADSSGPATQSGPGVASNERLEHTVTSKLSCDRRQNCGRGATTASIDSTHRSSQSPATSASMCRRNEIRDLEQRFRD